MAASGKTRSGHKKKTNWGWEWHSTDGAVLAWQGTTSSYTSRAELGMLTNQAKWCTYRALPEGVG